MRLSTEMPSALAARELWLVWLLGACAFVAVPLALGGIGISWDGLNHHFYLGWMAQAPRFERDLLAASFQSYQYPYLYWPGFRLAMAGFSGAAAGAVLALLQSTAIPAVWLAARACCPGQRWADMALRVAAVALAFLGSLSLSLLDSMSNDMLASVPLIWAFALALLPLGTPAPRRLLGCLVASGFLAGVAIGFKLSNAPLALALPALWFMAPAPLARLARHAALAVLALLAGYLLSYGYWGWQVWTHFGNPIYPLYDSWFEPLRALTGWQP